MASSTVNYYIVGHDKASDKFARAGAAAERSSTHMSHLGDKLRSLAKWGGLAAGAAVVFATKFGIDAVKAAAADDVSTQKLSLSLKKNAGATDESVAAVERWITKQGIALGVTDEELRPAVQRLAESMGSVKKAQDLASLAMDVAAGKGKTVKQVADAMAKAHDGNTGALGRLGIKTKDAEGKTLSFKDQIKSLSDTFGGQAATKAQTFQGKMDRMKIAFNETKEAIGYKLMPVLLSLSTWFLEKGIPAIKKTWEWLSDKLGPVFSGLADGPMPRMRQAWDAIKDALRDAQPFFDVVQATFVALWPVIKKIAEVGFPIMIDGIRKAGKALGAMGEVMKFVWNNIMAPSMRFFAAAISKVLDSLGSLFGALASIPGAPKWIGKTADALHHAAGEVDAFGNSIKNIPDHKNVAINVRYNYSGLTDPGRGHADVGLPPPSGQVPKGQRHVNAGGRWAPSAGVQSGGVSVETLQAALSGMVLKVVGLDPGQEAYLQVGGVF